MRKNGWKIALILALAVFAALSLVVRDPETGAWRLNLKPGLDIAGGTRLVYEIDASDLPSRERDGLAQDMIPILQRRIDPANTANLVIRPQGDTRIEIQLPVASAETQQRRRAYEQALEALERENINLLRVKRALDLPAEERAKRFETFAGDSAERQKLLNALAAAHDARKKVQEERDAARTRMDQRVKEISDTTPLSGAVVESLAPTWARKDPAERTQAVDTFIEQQIKDDDADKQAEARQKAGSLVRDYLAAYEQWAKAVQELTREGGLNEQWDQANHALESINVNVTLLTSVLDMPDSAERRKKLESFQADFPDRADKIAAVASAFERYAAVRGRLDDPEDLKRMLRGAGVLEFRILPSDPDSSRKTNVSELEAYKEALATKGPRQASDDRYVWVKVEDPETWTREMQHTITATFGDDLYVLASNQPNEKMLHGGEKDWRLTRARPTVDPQTGRRAVAFSLDSVGGSLFYNVTRNNIGRPLCIILDGQAISAPRINSAISQHGTITGEFTQTELKDLINKLNAGSFRASLSEVPISEVTIGATIGADNMRAGIMAGLVGLAAVAVFMVFYYLRSGLVADVALLLNLLFILAIMSVWQATFTLPGIAGLILTIGMSVDANVLIFERIREEQERGSPIRTAIANGYDRAFSTIFDANITTFFVALILYLAASEEIKGFAIVLMLGILSSMFTALFVTRTIYAVQLDSGLLAGHLRMFQLIKNARIRWMRWRPVFLAVSTVLVVGGLAVFFLRDETANSKYDIEFTGGTSVQIDLKPSSPFTEREEVAARFREVARNEFQNDALAAAQVYRVGESDLKYEITTTETNKTVATVTFDQAGETVESVRAAIQQAAAEVGGRLYNLAVKPGATDRTFQITTSQVNTTLVQSVLEKALPDAEVSEPEVDEVVTDAVRRAFEGYLAAREDLGVEIASTERISDSDVALSEFLGGVKITVTLKKEATAADLMQRFRDIRFKADMEDLEWYRYQIFKTDLTVPANEEKLRSFMYVSVHPEAGIRELDEQEWSRFVANEQTKIIQAGSLSTSLSRVTQIDPSIGAEAQTRALIAIVLSLIAIVGYIWVRFGTARYGVAAIVALVHDVCITLGAVTACAYLANTAVGRMLLIGDFKINLQIIAAFLTIIGYSLNDTIVVFDRIRENRGKLATLTPTLISDSINQTLSRTLLTSFTTFLVVLIMYIWGGPGLRGFTFAMLIGIVVGTYSSIAIAAPLLLIGGQKEAQR